MSESFEFLSNANAAGPLDVRDTIGMQHCSVSNAPPAPPASGPGIAAIFSDQPDRPARHNHQPPEKLGSVSLI